MERELSLATLDDLLDEVARRCHAVALVCCAAEEGSVDSPAYHYRTEGNMATVLGLGVMLENRLVDWHKARLQDCYESDADAEEPDEGDPR